MTTEDKKKRREEMKRREKQREKLGRIKSVIKYLYQHRRLEPLILLALSIVPDAKYVSQRYIHELVGFELLRRIGGRVDIMQSLSQLTRKGLLESYSLLQHRGSGVSSDEKEKLEQFIKEFVVGPVITVGQGQTQSIFRLTEKGRGKLKDYTDQKIINLNSPEDEFLEIVLGKSWESSL